MLSRDTHARIYQGEFSKREYEEILHLAGKRNASAQELILNAIAFYLKNGGLSKSLSVEMIMLDGPSLRVYLWLPYDMRDKIELMMKEKGSYIQVLVRKSIEAYKKRQVKD